MIIVTFFSALYLALENQKDFALAFLSIMIACISVVLGIDSFVLGKKSKEIAIESKDISIESKNIAEESKQLSSDSEHRVKDIANANFLSVLSRFEDRRIDLQYHPQRLKIHPILIWKALVDLREAEELLEFCEIDIKHQKRLINLLDHLLKFVGRKYVKILWCEEVEHMLDMGLIGLKVDDKLSDNKNSMVGRIKQLFDEGDSVEINEGYISFMSGTIAEKDYRKLFINMRDQYKDRYRQQNP